MTEDQHAGSNTELSPAAKGILFYLVQWDFCVTKRYWWIVIPAPQYKNDARMDWRIQHPEGIPELKEHGFIEPHPEDPAVYKLTDAGRAEGRKLL